MKKHAEKIALGIAVIILIIAGFLWCKGWRQDVPNPDAESFADSARRSIQKADQHRDTVNKNKSIYETSLDAFNKSTDPDSIERTGVGARIRANAIRRADSLRRSTAR